MAHIRKSTGRREAIGFALGLAAAACGATLEDPAVAGATSPVSPAGVTQPAADPATDAAGAPTELDARCLEATAAGVDQTAPEWPEAAVLRVDAAEAGAVSLRWPDATDAGCVVRYRVSRDGATVGFTPARVVQLDLDETAPDAPHRYCVSAADAAGNVSRDALCAATFGAPTP